MSFNIDKRANRAIAHGALTNSKRPQSFVRKVSPTHATGAHGAYIYDQDNKKYIDFICALGSNLFGYGNQYVVDCIRMKCDNGLTFSLSSEVEVDAAERLKEVLPMVDKVRFLKTGTEAALASLRIARSHTGRKKVLQQGYNGWMDELISTSSTGNGVIESQYIENLTSLDQINDEIAAVIMEPVITTYDEKRKDFLKAIRKKTEETGTILIFDEIITGFRFPDFAVSRNSGISPDILLLGKSIAGGLPLSCVCLIKKELDKTDWFVSSTFAGETLSLNVLIKVIDLLVNKYKIQDLWDQGVDLIEKFNKICPDIMQISGYGTRGVFIPKNDEIWAIFMQEMHRGGILIGPSFFLNFENIKYKDPFLGSSMDCLLRTKTGIAKLNGDLPVKPLSQKKRES